MNWFTWEPYYKRVATDLELNITKDYEIAEKLNSLVKQHNSHGFNSTLEKISHLKKTKAWIFGAGPSLENDFEKFSKNYSPETDLIVGVDGSSLFLREQGYLPDIIFSDLDGSLDAIQDCLSLGSILILHAHGDNFNIVEKFYPEIVKYDYLPTVQTKPNEPFIYNFGGFTDGDRAISGVLEWFSSITVLLLGFTFGKIQGKYSKPTKLKNHTEAAEFKLKKLQFAKEFIQVLAKNYSNQIYNLSDPTEPISGVSQTFYTIT